MIARTTEKYLEVGVPVCYLNEQGDTIVQYGRYKFCQTDTIRDIGFVYENKQDARIICIDNQVKSCSMRSNMTTEQIMSEKGFSV